MRPIACQVIRTVLPTLLVIFALTMPAKGQLFLITSRPAVLGNDFINWADVGPIFFNPTNPFTVNSFNGNVTTVSEAGGTFYRFDQSSPFLGNFTPGDALLDSGGIPGTMMLSFASPLLAAGAQIQSDFYGAFTARIEAFDAANNSLGFFLQNGISNNNADNSAIFIGVGSTTQNIKKIGFSLSSVGGNPADFAINRVEMNSSAAVVPEGNSVALMAGGGLPFLFMVRRRFRKTLTS